MLDIVLLAVVVSRQQFKLYKKCNTVFVYVSGV